MGESNLQGLLFINRRASSTEAKKGLHEDKSLRARSEEVLVLYPWEDTAMQKLRQIF